MMELLISRPELLVLTVYVACFLESNLLGFAVSHSLVQLVLAVVLAFDLAGLDGDALAQALVAGGFALLTEGHLTEH
jgi:hypothetical protein